MLERKSRWNWFVCCVVLLPILYWASAPLTLRVLGQYGLEEQALHSIYIKLPSNWWRTIYTPVLWAAEDNLIIGPVTIKLFTCFGVDVELEDALISMARERGEDYTPLSLR